MKAAARPASTGYLYYVANPCKPGTHTFTKTYEEFKAAATQVQPGARSGRGQAAKWLLRPRRRCVSALPGIRSSTAARPRCTRLRIAALGLDAEYQLLPIPPELFEETVRALPGSGFHGHQRDDPAQARGSGAGR